MTVVASANYTDPRVYEPIEDDPQVVDMRRMIEADGRIPEITREALLVTDFGAQFLRACVLEPPTAPPPAPRTA